MNPEKQQVEHAKWLLEKMLSWIAGADVKAAAVLGLDTALLGGLAAAFGSSDLAARSTSCYWVLSAASVGLVAGILCVALATIPRVDGPYRSLIFFGRVSSQERAAYIAEFHKESEAAFLEDLLSQVHRNAQIASEKHMWVAKGVRLTFLAMIPWVIAIALLVRK